MGETEQSRETVVLEHVEASDFKVAAVDNTTITRMYDGTATTFELTFSRLVTTPIKESFEVVHEGSGIRQVSKPEYDTPVRRVKECAVLMRPDHAMGLVQRLMTDLSNLPDDQKERYNIPPDLLKAVERKEVEGE